MLSVIYIVVSMLFGLLFLIDCIRFRREINVFVKYGMIIGAILVGLDISLMFLIPNLFQTISIAFVCGMDIVAFVRMTVFACMGMYCCSILNLRDAPILRLMFRDKGPWPPLQPGRMVTAGLVTVLFGVGYSVLLFLITKPQLSDFLKNFSADQMAKFGVGNEPSLILGIIVLEFAFAEEIVFRLGIQNYIARQFKLEGRKYGYAIIAATALWSLAHANILNPEWVKIAQVFPFGIALGLLFRKYGIECCILVHGLFNLVMMFIGSGLIGN